MGFIIDENTIRRYLSDYLDYLSVRDNNFKRIFIENGDSEGLRNAGAWYNRHPDTGEHRIFLNLSNLDYLLYYLSENEIGADEFFGILTLMAGNEYRHFEEGRSMWDGVPKEGFTLQDGLETQMVLYIRYFFDVYYKRNKGYLPFEENAVLFSIKNGIDFIKEKFPNVDAEKAILDSVNFLGSLHGEIAADGNTYPYHSDSIDDLIKELNRRIDENYRHPWLPATLRASSEARLALQREYGIDWRSFMSDEFIYGYKDIEGGYNKDLYVVKKILDTVNDKEKSLREFNILKGKYLEKKL